MASAQSQCFAAGNIPISSVHPPPATEIVDKNSFTRQPYEKAASRGKYEKVYELFRTTQTSQHRSTTGKIPRAGTDKEDRVSCRPAVSH